MEAPGARSLCLMGDTKGNGHVRGLGGQAARV